MTASGTAVQIVAAAQQQLPEDVGKAGPMGLLLLVVLLIAVAFLVKSMTGHLKRLPRSFDPADQGERVDVPDDLSGLAEARKEPGQELLDTLRRAPLAIEPPRNSEGRSDSAG